MSESVPDDMFISTLVRARFHACSRQEAHLLATNYPQLMSKFILILEKGQYNLTTIVKRDTIQGFNKLIVQWSCTKER